MVEKMIMGSTGALRITGDEKTPIKPPHSQLNIPATNNTITFSIACQHFSSFFLKKVKKI
jgi:hypothetical protein